VPEYGNSVPWKDRLTVRVTGGVVLALIVIGIPFLILFHQLERSRQTEVVESMAAGLNQAVVDGLRASMLMGHPDVLDDSIRDLSRQPVVESVMLLDRLGKVKVSSDPTQEGHYFDRLADETCRMCHNDPTAGAASPAKRTIVTTVGEHRVLRIMSAIPNEPTCHRCHNPAIRNNGVLLMDLSLRQADRQSSADLAGTAALGGVMLIVTIFGLTWLLERLIHRPIRAVVATSRLLETGDLEARVPVHGSGELGRLSLQINRMSENLATSLSELNLQQRELATIVDAVDDEIVVFDAERNVVTSNTGNPSGDAALVDEVFETGELRKTIVTRREADGSERTVEIYASPICDSTGRVTRVVEARRDISERRQLEASLVHSERLASLGLLASGLSHEINNPLGAIGLGVEGLVRSLKTSSDMDPAVRKEVEERLGLVQQEVRRGKSITDRLLHLARPSTGSRNLVDINRILEDTLALLRPQIRRQTIEVVRNLSDRLPPFVGDESHITQVVMNLIFNAVQAMDTGGGTLRLMTRMDEGHIVMEVEDTGEGIAAENQGRIFDPFFTTKPTGKGTGLGLFICHRIVVAMGGEILVQSQRGEGARFTVILPGPEEEKSSHA
jgi:signal transduction histidine kinase